MKKVKQYILIIASLLVIGGCDKDFEEVNTDPFAITEIDPALLFAGAQRTYLQGWETENTIVQQFVNPYNDGATLGFNFNADIDTWQTAAWNTYTGAIKNLTQVLYLLEGTTDRKNLQSMARIWRANAFMSITDHFGDVPYSEAGQAAILGDEYFFPSYDNDEDIYAGLYTEIKEALAALDPAGDYVSADLFYGKNAFIKVNDAATQVAKWKKLGNSLLLRLGMRYSKVDPTKAASIVAEAFAGGVMTANADNTMVVYDGTNYINNTNNGLINNNPRFYYAAEPFVNQLKSTNDPRCKYLVASYAEPNNPLGDPNPDLTIANQYGVPIGVTAQQLASAPYRGTKGTGFNYSQMNVKVAASISAPTFWMTYAQVSLLLAEAAHRGWIPGGATVAQQYYEAGIRADMTNYNVYLARTASTLPQVSVAEQDAYIAQPAVAFNSTDALKLINTQYWIANITDGSEAWANFRRSGFPALSRNAVNDLLLENGGDGYVHRFSYPDAELSRNNANYEAAVAAIGGDDNVVFRTFWDKP
ncbi:SusD/RagB family nutrient-binding outer membrane lipoprotein [bacterium]|nr:SusD/RagB family nutrient-binding outer membrane lipoprotein [bacterium]